MANLIPPATIDKLFEMYNAGEKYAVISLELGVSENTIVRHCGPRRFLYNTKTKSPAMIGRQLELKART